MSASIAHSAICKQPGQCILQHCKTDLKGKPVKSGGTTQQHPGPTQQHGTTPTPRKRGRPPLHRNDQWYLNLTRQPSNGQVTTPLLLRQPQQPSNITNNPASEVSKELLQNDRKRRRCHYWVGRSHLVRATSRYHRPARPVMTREKIASEAAKYVSKEFLDVLRAKLRLPSINRVKKKQASCSGKPSRADGQGECKQ